MGKNLDILKTKTIGYVIIDKGNDRLYGTGLLYKRKIEAKDHIGILSKYYKIQAVKKWAD